MFHELKERNANIKEMIPQIEEKCKIEKNLEQRIYQAQKDINELLEKTKQRLLETEEKARSANSKASKERESTEAELNAARWELNKAK